jgi:hypothetical protein
MTEQYNAPVKREVKWATENQRRCPNSIAMRCASKSQHNTQTSTQGIIRREYIIMQSILVEQERIVQHEIYSRRKTIMYTWFHFANWRAEAATIIVVLARHNVALFTYYWAGFRAGVSEMNIYASETSKTRINTFSEGDATSKQWPYLQRKSSPAILSRPPHIEMLRVTTGTQCSHFIRRFRTQTKLKSAKQVLVVTSKRANLVPASCSLEWQFWVVARKRHAGAATKKVPLVSATPARTIFWKKIWLHFRNESISKYLKRS